MQCEIHIDKQKITNIRSAEGETRIISDSKNYIFHNAHVYPAFAESHGHLLLAGQSLAMPDISQARSAAECLQIIKKAPLRRGIWIYSYGWNQEIWTDNAPPNLKLIDEYFPDIPVCLIRTDWHAAWINSKALQLLNITADTQSPQGGCIEKDSKNTPSGILLDNAIKLAHNEIPEYSQSQKKEFILKAIDHLIQFGISEIHEMMLNIEDIPLFDELAEKNQLKINVIAYLNSNSVKNLDSLQVRPYTINKFELRGIKLFADGALGSRGAALFEAYSDSPQESGLLILDQSQIYKIAAQALSYGFDVATHAIGDLANSETIKAYAMLFDNDLVNSNILRLEHAQIISPEDLSILAQYPIICSLQPTHFLSDIQGMAQKRLSNRLGNAYRWLSILQSNIICSGSDFPIESPAPIHSIQIMTDIKHDAQFQRQETISPQQALDAYTINPRIATNAQNLRGSLDINQQADLVILDSDIISEKHKAKIIALFIDGEPVFINNNK